MKPRELLKEVVEAASELFSNPKSDYTRALFAAAFNLETAHEGVVRSDGIDVSLFLILTSLPKTRKIGQKVTKVSGAKAS